MHLFKFDLTKSQNSENIEGDYYFAMIQINDFFETEVGRQLNSIKEITSDIEYLKESIIHQSVSLIKNNYLSFLLVHEYKIAKKSGVLNEKEGKRNFKEFIELTNTIEWLSYVFDKYPVLQPRIEIFVNNFYCYFQVFLNRLIQDYSNFCKTFKINDRITDIRLFLGDPHKNGKFVIKVEFQESNSLFFKPRDFKNEIFFEKTILFLNTLDAQIDFKIPTVLDFEEYSWTAELNNKNRFISKKEIKDFFKNQGKLLCLFHLLGTTDIIPDNLLITDNKPGFFDLECLITKPRYLKQEGIRYEYEESLVKIGMLPEWMINNNFERNVLSSTFFRFNTQLVQTKIWKTIDYDFEYTNSLEKFSNNKDGHLPMYKNNPVELNIQHLQDVIEGFKGMYKLIINNREEIAYFFMHETKNISKNQRIILHPTSVYSLLLREISIPEYMRGVSEENDTYQEIIERIIEISETDNYKIDKKKLARSIKDQLAVLDIPYFFINSDTGFLMDGQNNILSRNWKFDSTQFILDRLNALSEKSLRFQLSILINSCEFAFEMYDKPLKKNLITSHHHLDFFGKLNDGNYNKNILLQTAESISQSIMDSSFQYEDTINWVSKVMDPIDGRYHISLLGYDLYDGLSGMVMLYLYLYKNTEKDIYKKFSLNIFKLLNDLTKNRYEKRFYSQLEVENKKFHPISPYSYPMCFLYLTTHVKSVLGEEYISNEMTKISLKQLTEITIDNNNFDYLLGAAGSIDFLIDFIEEFKGEKEIVFKAQSLLDQNLELLFKNSIIDVTGEVSWPFQDEGKSKRIGGFAHGSGGIAYSLFKAARKLGNDRILNFAKGALAHDRTFYDKDIEGWRDMREENDMIDSTAWCHGSSGIGLSRVLISQYYHDDLLEKEISIAKNNILKNGFLDNQCICHGDLGNLEILKIINNYEKDFQLNNHIYNYIHSLCLQYEKGIKFQCGDGGKMELLGLFMGLSGFAYQMMRFYNWDETPSLLCLETPIKTKL